VDLVHVSDVVAGFESVAQQVLSAPTRPLPEDGIVRYGLSAGETPSVRELVATIDGLTGGTLAVRWGARPDRPVEMRRRWPVGPPPPGWQPRVTLTAGLGPLLRGGADRG
jgi:nucleoside-diphosphate-sugar epimerase